MQSLSVLVLDYCCTFWAGAYTVLQPLGCPPEILGTQCPAHLGRASLSAADSTHQYLVVWPCPSRLMSAAIRPCSFLISRPAARSGRQSLAAACHSRRSESTNIYNVPHNFRLSQQSSLRPAWGLYAPGPGVEKPCSPAGEARGFGKRHVAFGGFAESRSAALPEPQTATKDQVKITPVLNGSLKQSS